MKLTPLAYLMITSSVMAGQSQSLSTMPPEILGEIGKRLSLEEIARLEATGDRRLLQPSKQVALFREAVYKFDLIPDLTGQINPIKLQRFLRELDRHNGLRQGPVLVDLEINTHHNALPSQFWQDILARSKNFAKLTLKDTIFDENAVAYLHAADLSNLKEFTIQDPEMNDSGLQIISANPSFNGTISLDLWDNKDITDEGFSGLTNLTFLHLGWDQNITDEVARSLTNLRTVRRNGVLIAN